MKEKEGGAKREACLGLREFVRVPQRDMPSCLSRWSANVRPKGEHEGLELTGCRFRTSQKKFRHLINYILIRHTLSSIRSRTLIQHML